MPSAVTFTREDEHRLHELRKLREACDGGSATRGAVSSDALPPRVHRRSASGASPLSSATPPLLPSQKMDTDLAAELHVLESRYDHFIAEGLTVMRRMASSPTQRGPTATSSSHVLLARARGLWKGISEPFQGRFRATGSGGGDLTQDLDASAMVRVSGGPTTPSQQQQQLSASAVPPQAAVLFASIRHIALFLFCIALVASAISTSALVRESEKLFSAPIPAPTDSAPHEEEEAVAEKSPSGGFAMHLIMPHVLFRGSVGNTSLICSLCVMLCSATWLVRPVGAVSSSTSHRTCCVQLASTVRTLLTVGISCWGLLLVYKFQLLWLHPLRGASPPTSIESDGSSQSALAHASRWRDVYGTRELGLHQMWHLWFLVFAAASYAACGCRLLHVSLRQWERI